MRKGGTFAIVLWFLAGSVQVARAGNDETYFMSAEAALVGGAVVATSDDVGAIWYNPAGLGGVARQQLDLSLSVVALHIRTIPEGIQTDFGDETRASTIDGSRIDVISPSTAYVRQLGGLNWGLGVYKSRDDLIRVTGGAEQRTADTYKFIQVELFSQHERYHYGIAFGAELSPSLRLGASLFGVYDHRELVGDAGLGDISEVVGSGSNLALQIEEQEFTDRYGVEAKLGAQLMLAQDRLRLGLVLASPVILIHESVRATALSTIAAIDGATGEGGVVSQYEATVRKPAKSGFMAPARLTVGVGVAYPSFRLGVEGDYAHALRSMKSAYRGEVQYEVDRRAVFNLRAGGAMPITDKAEIGLGLFTDRSAERADDFAEFDVDFYGATAGVSYETDVSLAPTERAPHISMRTTISLRYALGLGSTSQVRASIDYPRDFGVEQADAEKLRFHELYLQIGSAFEF